MNDRDILRHERLDRVNTFGIENHADLPAGCEAITRFANIATISRAPRKSPASTP
jgi:hypothetical protein